MSKLKEGVAWDFTPVDEHSGFLTGHIVLDGETIKTLGPLNEGTAYCAALQVLYGIVAENFGLEWVNNLLKDTAEQIEAVKGSIVETDDES